MKELQPLTEIITPNNKPTQDTEKHLERNCSTYTTSNTDSGRHSSERFKALWQQGKTPKSSAINLVSDILKNIL